MRIGDRRATSDVSDPAPVVIVSGAPGSGKTALSRQLVKSKERALHFVSDVFYDFIDSPVDPTKPESQRQNTVIMQALAQSVGAFSRGGYTTFLDGVIGPWFLDVFREPLQEGTATHYVVLRASPEEGVRRTRAREGSGMSPKVVHMSAAFSDLGDLERHAIETTGLDDVEVYRRVFEGLASGAFRLDWALVPAMPSEADDG